MWCVRFSEPSALRRRRDRKATSAGDSRDGRRRVAGSARPRAASAGLAAGAPAARQPFGEAFDDAEGFLAARSAEIEPLLLAKEDRVGVVGAAVAALAAILLRHRRHQARRERAILGQRHALVRGKRRIVPGRFVVAGERRVAARLRGRKRFRARCRAGRRYPSARSQPSAAARKPLSHARCSSLNGAFAGTSSAGARAAWTVMGAPPRPARGAAPAHAGARMRRSSRSASAVREIGAKQSFHAPRHVLRRHVRVDSRAIAASAPKPPPTWRW